MKPIAIQFEKIEKGAFLDQLIQRAKLIWKEINLQTEFFQTAKLLFIWPPLPLLPQVREGREYPEVFLYECEDHELGNGLHLVGCYIPESHNVCVIHSSTRI